MNHLLDDEDDLQGHADHRELTLSTGAVLGIFLGLAAICALFFAFGYNMGQKVAQPAFVASADNTNSSTSSTNFNAFKPAAGSPLGGATPAPAPAFTSPAISPGSMPASGSSPASTRVTPAAPHEDGDTPTQPAASPAVASPAAAAPVAAAAAAPAHPASAAPVATAAPAAAQGNFIVQVAAVSHQEDADLLVGALKGKGYAVAARTEPQDKLMHIQVGPFNNRKDADAMRQRLLNDGYNAIVK